MQKPHEYRFKLSEKIPNGIQDFNPLYMILHVCLSARHCVAACLCASMDVLADEYSVFLSAFSLSLSFVSCACIVYSTPFSFDVCFQLVLSSSKKQAMQCPLRMSVVSTNKCHAEIALSCRRGPASLPGRFNSNACNLFGSFTTTKAM